MFATATVLPRAGGAAAAEVLSVCDGASAVLNLCQQSVDGNFSRGTVASSNGVLVDTTEPRAGYVADGLVRATASAGAWAGVALVPCENCASAPLLAADETAAGSSRKLDALAGLALPQTNNETRELALSAPLPDAACVTAAAGAVQLSWASIRDDESGVASYALANSSSGVWSSLGAATAVKLPVSACLLYTSPSPRDRG